MTKEKIIDAVLNLKVLEIYDEHDYRVYAAPWLSGEDTVLSVCSKGIIVIYDGETMSYISSLIPFEKVAKIVISKEEVIE